MRATCPARLILLYLITLTILGEKCIVIWQLKCRKNGARRNFPLQGNGSINTCSGNGYARDNRGTVDNNVFYAVRADVI
jgi:hypothetical protein